MASNEASPWPTVTFLGVLVGISLGLVIYSLFRRQDGGVMELPDGGELSLGAMPTVNKSPLLGKPRTSIARTINISVSKPTMLLRAVGGDWRASVRVLSPVSSFASVSIGQGSTDSVVIPAGSSQDIWVPKGQYLYAIGSEAGVCVSVSGGEG